MVQVQSNQAFCSSLVIFTGWNLKFGLLNHILLQHQDLHKVASIQQERVVKSPSLHYFMLCADELSCAEQQLCVFKFGVGPDIFEALVVAVV